ncbi:MAG TPA: hypothetical protein VIM15_08080 [Gemmatimonadaceae bacterium]
MRHVESRPHETRTRSLYRDLSELRSRGVLEPFDEPARNGELNAVRKPNDDLVVLLMIHSRDDLTV